MALAPATSAGGGGEPTGPAGGVLDGDYPDPDFAATALATLGGLAGAVLFDETKGSDAATFDTGAGGFSAAYKHLVVITQLRTTEAIILSSAVVTLNADGGTNYDAQIDRGRDTTAAATDAQASASAISMIAPGASAAAGVFGAQLLILPNYAGTVAEKSALMVGGFADEAATGGDAGVKTLHWRNTAAIARLTFTAQSASNFLTGSRVTVYGLG